MLKKFPFPPGIEHRSTSYAASGSWYDSDNVRFRSSMAESIGGWQKDGTYELDGIGRASFTTRDYSGNIYRWVGTNRKFYAIAGDAAFDITPIESTATVAASSYPAYSHLLLTRPIFEGGGFVATARLRVVDPNHGRSENDWIRFESVDTGSGNYTQALLEQSDGFQIMNIVNEDLYWIYIVDQTTGEPVPYQNNSNVNFCTEYTIDRFITSGINSQVTGQGFGAGTWGGDSFIPTSYTITTDTVTTDGTGTITIDATDTGALGVDDFVYLQGLTGAIGSSPPSNWTSDFETEYLNDHWWKVSAVGVGDFSIDLTEVYGASFTIPGTTAGGGSGGTFYVQDGTTVTGATRGWGDSSQESEISAELRRVYLDNYGEDMMFCNSGGPIYYYDVDVNTSTGIPATNLPVKSLTDIDSGGLPPALVDSFLISKKDGHCVALGCSDIAVANTLNSMLVRWADQNNPFDWVPSSTNTSGGQVLRSGSRILGGISTKDEVVIFTDSAVYSMRFIGPPDTFSFNLITDGVEVLNARTAVNAANAVFFMGNDGFYVYKGAVEPIPCPVSAYIFSDINLDQAEKCFGGVNSRFSEVIWFYPSSDSFEPNKYVVFNYEENVWYYGTLDMTAMSSSDEDQTTSYNRTAWRDAIVFGNPSSTYISKYAVATNLVPFLQKSRVMLQEIGASADGLELNTYLESGDIDISNGENFSFVSRIVPDVEVFNALGSGTTASIGLDIYGRDFPGEASSSVSSNTLSLTFPAGSGGNGATFTPVGNATAVRARARSLAIRYSSSGTTFQWRIGDSRFDLRPDGKR